MPELKKKLTTRIVVLGSKNVGKSAVVQRCIKNKFVNENTASKDVSYQYDLTIGKKEVKLDIVDYNNKNDALLSYADGYIICYSIDNIESFNDVNKYLEKIYEVNTFQPNIALLANKSDLYLNREVSSCDGFQFAKEINALFYETSARIPVIDIRQIFYDLFKSIKSANKLRKSSSRQETMDYGSQLDLNSLFSHSAIKPIGSSTTPRKSKYASPVSGGMNSGYFSKNFYRFNTKANVRKSSFDLFYSA